VLSPLWRWLADPAHRPLLSLWVDAYARSLSPSCVGHFLTCSDQRPCPYLPSGGRRHL